MERVRPRFRKRLRFRRSCRWSGLLAGAAIASVSWAMLAPRPAQRRSLCWGRAGFGRLGIGPTDDSERRAVLPIDSASAAGDPMVDVNASFSHTCALRRWALWRAGESWTTSASTDRVWGFRHPVPEALAGAPTSQALARGSDGNLVCVVTNDRELYCFGQNRTGQLGDRTITARRSFAPVLTAAGDVALSGVVAAESTHLNACALTEDGRLDCCGSNRGGQLARRPFPWRFLFPVASES